MAILNELPGVVVEVLVDGTLLQEYRDNDNHAENTRSCYVEAIANEQFAIRISTPLGFTFEGDCLAYSMTVDGRRQDYPVVLESDCSHRDHVEVVDSWQRGSGSVGYFAFANRGFGEIKIEVSDAYQVPNPRRTQSYDPTKLTLAELEGPNAAFGGYLSRLNNLSPADWEHPKLHRVQGVRRVHGTFVFEYRSMATLQSEVILLAEYSGAPYQPGMMPNQPSDVNRIHGHGQSANIDGSSQVVDVQGHSHNINVFGDSHTISIYGNSHMVSVHGHSQVVKVHGHSNSVFVYGDRHLIDVHGHSHNIHVRGASQVFDHQISMQDPVNKRKREDDTVDPRKIMRRSGTSSSVHDLDEARKQFDKPTTALPVRLKDWMKRDQDGQGIGESSTKTFPARGKVAVGSGEANGRGHKPSE